MDARESPVHPDLIRHPDGRHRCWWPGEDPLYVAYHDTEWGVPEHDDRALFEKLILDGFQAGLSWITILRKRENFRRAFNGFEPEAIARFTDAHVEALMLDPGIVRNRAKIQGTVAGAQAWLKIQERRGFSRYLWDFVDGRPLQPNRGSRADVPAETEVSRRISKATSRSRTSRMAWPVWRAGTGRRRVPASSRSPSIRSSWRRSRGMSRRTRRRPSASPSSSTTRPNT
jgi:DNA-3-methyladenine glycosylase I